MSPHRVCMSGAQTPLWRGPWGRCDSAEDSPCDVLVSACVVCRLVRFARYLGRRNRGEGGRQEASLVSSLSSLTDEMGGAPLRPTSASGCHQLYQCSQSGKKTGKFTPQMDVKA